MIPIVEDYLIDLLESKFAYLRSNPSQVGKILKTTKSRTDKLAVYLSENKINVIKGYPRTPSQLPCVAIMLSGEDEMQEGLGDYGEDDDLDIRSFQEVLTVSTSRDGNIVQPYIRLSNFPIESIDNMADVSQGAYIDDSSYDVTLPDIGIVELYGGFTDGDQIAILYNYRATSMELTQVLYEANYRLECWTSNGDLTVELYHLVKWGLISGRDVLGKDHDLFRQKLGGSDFEPATSYFPEFVYRRAMTYWCQFTASTPIEEISYITGVEVNQDIYTNNGGD